MKGRAVRDDPIDRSVNVDDTFGERADQVAAVRSKETTLSTLLSLSFSVVGICRIIPGIMAAEDRKPTDTRLGRGTEHSCAMNLNHKQIDHLSNGFTMMRNRDDIG